MTEVLSFLESLGPGKMRAECQFVKMSLLLSAVVVLVMAVVEGVVAA